MFYPQAFMTWGGWDLGKLIVPLIQIIMFGMGTTLSVADFTRVLKMPWPVFIGFALQFTDHASRRLHAGQDVRLPGALRPASF